MATERQIAANRLNAQRCTGPKTPEGKSVASRNAVTHGLRSHSGLLPGETLEDFSDLRDRVFAELAPDSAIEMELAERIASLLWRLRRVPAFEAALIAWTMPAKRRRAFLCRTSRVLGAFPTTPTVRPRNKDARPWALARWFPEDGFRRQAQPL